MNLATLRQHVVVEGLTPEWCAVASGVPEGSVLGPSLFFYLSSMTFLNSWTRISYYLPTISKNLQVRRLSGDQRAGADVLKCVYSYTCAREGIPHPV